MLDPHNTLQMTTKFALSEQQVLECLDTAGGCPCVHARAVLLLRVAGALFRLSRFRVNTLKPHNRFGRL